MAYIKIIRHKNPPELERYLLEGRENDDSIELEGCCEGMIAEQFRTTQMYFGIRENHRAIHIIQSFSVEDSSKLAPEEYTKIGRKLMERQFPGHEFAVVAHVDSGKVHNHIMLNPVHSETGRKIPNKIRLLQKIRDTSDEICIESGLTIIEQQSNEKWKKAPEHVRKAKRSGGFSWVLDLKEKANFARSIATSFDEYAGVLNKFGIQVRVEQKNIIYHYPDRRSKRGDSYGLGERYHKKGLIKEFEKNYARLFDVGIKKTPIEKVDFKDHWVFHRNDSKYIVPEYRYQNLAVPPKLFDKAQKLDIQEIAKQNGHKFVLNDNGEMRLKGKEYILLKDNRWINQNTKAQGGALEFLNFCHNESWSKTLSRIDDSGIMKRITSVIEESTPSFKAFYISPKFKEEKKRPNIEIESLFADAPKILKSLAKAGRVKVLPGAKVKFYSQEHSKSSLTVHKTNEGWVCRQSKGINGTFFKSIKNAKSQLLIFEDPQAFGNSGKLIDRILNDKKAINMIVPLKPLGEFLNENEKMMKSASKVRVIRSKELFSWGKNREERKIDDNQRTEWEKQYALKFESLDEMFSELILGRTI